MFSTGATNCPPQKGLTMLILPLESPGPAVRFAMEVMINVFRTLMGENSSAPYQVLAFPAPARVTKERTKLLCCSLADCPFETL